MLNRTIAPPIKDAVDFNLQLKKAETFTLDNGVTVYSIDAGAQEVSRSAAAILIAPVQVVMARRSVCQRLATP